MNGEKLRKAIKSSGKSMTEIAAYLNTTPQNLQSWFAAADIKTGTLEKIAEALGVNPASFYDGSVKAENHSVAFHGDGNKVQTTDSKLIGIINRQSEQITTAQQQISDLIEILKKQ